MDALSRLCDDTFGRIFNPKENEKNSVSLNLTIALHLHNRKDD